MLGQKKSVIICRLLLVVKHFCVIYNFFCTLCKEMEQTRKLKMKELKPVCAEYQLEHGNVTEMKSRIAKYLQLQAVQTKLMYDEQVCISCI